jgi:hypothetical protein
MSLRRQRRTSLPQLPSLPTPARAPSLTPLVRVPRQRRTAESNRPYPPKPDGYLYSLGEWVVEYYLTRIKGYKKIGQDGDEYTTTAVIPNRSFFRQVQVRGLGIFVNTDDTRIDFLIPQGAGVALRDIAIDPYDNFTHPNPALDLLKRTVLMDQQSILLIWLENDRLVAGDFQIIDDALRGIDTSARAHGG